MTKTNEERNQEIARRIQAGEQSLEEIAAAFGLSRQRVSVIGKRHGVTRGGAGVRSGARRPGLDERDRKIEELAREGVRYEAIGARFGISVGAVSKILVGRGYRRGRWGGGRKPSTGETS